MAAAVIVTVVAIAPSATAFSPKASRITSYDHVCGGDVDTQCCTQPSSNPLDGFCDPLYECIVYVSHQCVNRPLPSRDPRGQDGECAGTVDHQCNVCVFYYPTATECYWYAECTLYERGVCVLYRP